MTNAAREISEAHTPDQDKNAVSLYPAGLMYREVVGQQQAPPVLLLHGWGSNVALMRPIADALAASHRVHNVDLPGHGHSPVPESALGVPEHADLVAEYIQTEMGGGPITLIGHSNGGRIGLFMAASRDYGHLFRQLILVSPSGMTPTRGAAYKWKRAIARILRFPGRLLPKPAADFFNDWITHSLVWRALGSSDYNALSGVMRETFVRTVNFHVDEVVGQIACPVLLLWGDRDTAVNRAQMDNLEARIPDCGLVVLEGAGHYGHLDAPAKVTEAIKVLLSGDSASANDASEGGTRRAV